jgi:hydroxypyruvate reductase
VASANEALAAATEEARVAGYSPLMLGDDIEGESREVARAHAALALDHAAQGRKTALLSGGETTVTLTGSGRGGPNAEYALALCLALDGAPSIAALACDTDGIDGSEDNAGAVVASDSLARCIRAGIDAKARLTNNDAYGAFAAIGDLVITGPTYTNVNDFRAILVG